MEINRVFSFGGKLHFGEPQYPHFIVFYIPLHSHPYVSFSNEPSSAFAMYICRYHHPTWLLSKLLLLHSFALWNFPFLTLPIIHSHITQSQRVYISLSCTSILNNDAMLLWNRLRDLSRYEIAFIVNMNRLRSHRQRHRRHWDYFFSLSRSKLQLSPQFHNSTFTTVPSYPSYFHRSF